MKNLKQHKAQILAALALAFSLGMVMPNAVFAATDEPAAQATDAATPAAKSTDLFNAIQTAQSEEGYSDYYALYTAQTDLAKDLAGAKEADLQKVVNAVNKINSEAEVAGLSATALNDYVLAMPGYSDWKTLFDAIAAVNKATGNTTLTADAIAKNMSAADIQKYYDIINGFNNRVTGTLADNIVKLVDRIDSRDSFKAYRDASALVANVETLEDADAAEAAVTAAATAVKAEIAKWNPAVDGYATMTNEELVQTVRGREEYKKFFTLYDALDFYRAITGKGEAFNAANISKNMKQDQQMAAYSKLAAAANAIDNTVMKGLMTYELPNTGAPTTDVEAPDTGIIGLIESGALDMGTITLIVSVAVAALAGFGLIAKLYLKHKF